MSGTLPFLLSCSMLFCSCSDDAPASAADSGAPAEAGLAAAYSNSDAICEQYDECGVSPLSQCRVGFPGESEVLGALRRLDWSAQQESQCLQTVLSLDECVAGLGCSDVTAYNSAFFSLADGWVCVRGGPDPAASLEPTRCPAPIPCQGETEDWAERCSALNSLLTGP